MPEKPAGERTEKPSSRRIRKTRQKGEVPHSQELPSIISLVTLLAVSIMMGPKLFGWYKVQITESMAINNELLSGPEAFLGFFAGKMIEIAVILSPFFIALMIAGVAGSVLVGGMTWSIGPLKWKLSAIFLWTVFYT